MMPKMGARLDIRLAERSYVCTLSVRFVWIGSRSLTPPRRGGPSRIERAVSRFAEIAPTLAASIREHCDQSNAEALWRAAHGLKSSAGALGAKQLSQRCAEIEARARNTGVEDVRTLVDALDDDLTAAIKSLQGLIGELNVPAA